jgi:hypothetical protein
MWSLKSSAVALSVLVTLIAAFPGRPCVASPITALHCSQTKLQSNPSVAQTGQPQFATIALEGDPAPAEIGGRYSKIESSAMSESGPDVAFSADVSGSSITSAILLNSSGTTRVILRSGDATPAGGTFAAFHELDVDDGEYILFRAELQGVPASEGVFLWQSPSSVQTVQLAGDKTNNRYPGFTYKSFSQLTLYSFTNLPGTPATYAFLATLEEDQMQAVVWDDLSQQYPTQTVAMSGSPGQFYISAVVPNSVADSFAVSRLSASIGICLVIEGHQIGKSSEFSIPVFISDTLGEMLTWDPTLTQRLHTGAGKLIKLETPASTSVGELTYALGQFVKQGRSGKAIVVDQLNQFGVLGPTVILQTGERFPALNHDKIEDLSVPVVNRGSFGVRTPDGLVATVQLSDGRKALWVGVLTIGVPRINVDSKLALLGGATNDTTQTVLSSFNPVRLSNTGTLLLSGAVGGAANPRNGIFLLSGLF